MEHIYNMNGEGYHIHILITDFQNRKGDLFHFIEEKIVNGKNTCILIICALVTNIEDLPDFDEIIEEENYSINERRDKDLYHGYKIGTHHQSTKKDKVSFIEKGKIKKVDFHIPMVILLLKTEILLKLYKITIKK